MKAIKHLAELISKAIPESRKVFLRNKYYSWMSGYALTSNHEQSTITLHSGQRFIITGIPQFEVGNDLIALKGYLSYSTIKDGDIVIDAGASAGVTSLALSKMVGETGKVLALEPDPISREKLHRNIALNDAKNIIVHDKGLWNQSGFVNFTSDGQSSITGKGNEQIPVITIDHLSSLYGQPSFIKMDIEGAEIEALAGAKDTISKGNTEFAIASYHIRGGEKTCREVEKILRPYKKAYTKYSAHLTTYGINF